MASYTATKVARSVAGNYRENIFDIKPGALYTTGGVTLAQADINVLTRPGETASSILQFDSETNPAGCTAALDRTNSKMLFFVNGAEATATINTTSIRCSVRFGFSNYK